MTFALPSVLQLHLEIRFDDELDDITYINHNRIRNVFIVKQTNWYFDHSSGLDPGDNFMINVADLREMILLLRQRQMSSGVVFDLNPGNS